jgi:hypothetical protein
MASLIGIGLHTILDRPVVEADGRPVGRVGAVGSPHGELLRIGIDAGGGAVCISSGPSSSQLSVIAPSSRARPVRNEFETRQPTM